MKLRSRNMIALALCLLLARPVVQISEARAEGLESLISKSYLELLDLAPALKISRAEIEAFRQRLKNEEEAEKKRLQQAEQGLKAQIEQARKQLDGLNRQASRDSAEMAAERNKVQCSILKAESELREKAMAREHGLPVAFDNKRAKLDLIEQWPAKRLEIEQVIASGRARQRPHGNVEDIGIRKVGEGQEKDVKLGKEAIDQMKMYSMFPPEVEDKELNAYVRKLADSIAVNSDLKVPLKVVVLQSEEINAFALPGGFLFVNTGLIEKADNESELAGVIAHELAHVTARHGHRLMKRATVAGIIYQAAQVAAIIFTGGAVGIGTYYALQYGFFGLGLFLDLTLLGVSREFEAEADQLGVQYAWRAGYDPRGFITLFDKMASEKGYVRSASFFRTHPPFFNRILATVSEIEYLPKTEGLQVDSTAFQQTRELLRKLKPAWELEQKKRPTLRRQIPCEDEKEKHPAIASKED